MRKSLFFLLALFLMGVGCVPPRLLPFEKPTPEFIINQLQMQAQRVFGLKGTAQVQITQAGKSLHSDQVLFLRRPAWLRAETLSPLGTPQFYLVTDGEEVRIYNPEENKYYLGQAKSAHLAAFLPLAMNFGELISFFLGSPPLIEYETALVYKSPKEFLWVLELQNNSAAQRQILWVDPIDFHVQQAELYAGELIYNLAFTAFQQIDQYLFPQKIHYTSANYEVRVTYKEVSLNPSWGKEDFYLPIPRGAKVIYLE